VRFEKTSAQALSRDQLLLVVELLKNKWFAASPVTLTWNNDQAVSFLGKGFSGSLGFDQHSLWLELELSLILRPLQGKIRQTIERELAALNFQEAF
jgi:hypothetical protein